MTPKNNIERDKKIQFHLKGTLRSILDGLILMTKELQNGLKILEELIYQIELIYHKEIE